MIAHRHSTIRGADRILALEDGRLVESGTHGELYEAGGLYRRLCDLQFSSPPSMADDGGITLDPAPG